jgi:aminopeptidase N
VAGKQEQTKTERARYQIELKLDFDNKTYTGIERVRWVNRDDHSTSILFFHLYANLRAGAQQPRTQAALNALLADAEEPRLDVLEVRAAQTGTVLPFALDDQATTLRVNLREAVAPGAATEIEITFKGSVSEIDPEETGLLAHLFQQVGAVLRSERELRRARDVNFFCRGVMMLGNAYPVLAAREGGDWQRRVEHSIGDAAFADVADYSVRVNVAGDVALFTSGERVETSANEQQVFEGENIRNFAIIAGRTLRAEERMIDGVKVRSVYMPEHEKVGKRVLGITEAAVRTYATRFGKLPYKVLTVAEAPLIAGLGCAEFTGLSIIASAFYVDFDAPVMRNMPEIVREQRASLEDSLEFTVAHVVAHGWWGASVGNNPEREPVLDEALAHWSALLYYKEVHSEERVQGILNDQLRGVYKIYRTFGGEDMEANRPAREYRNFFQYAAIIASKGALMFTELRRLLGDEKFFTALVNYYQANMFEIAELEDLRGAFIAEAPLAQRRVVARTFNRWLSSKRGDEDISPPDPQLAAALGITIPQVKKANDGNAFARLGKFFWQQMTRIR